MTQRQHQSHAVRVSSWRRYILKAAEIVCSEKLKFLLILAWRETLWQRISDISANLDSQLKNKVKSFVTFSVALDESTDISDISQLAISHIYSWHWWDFVTEEFLGLVPMMDITTTNYIFNSLIGMLNRVRVDWSRAVSIVTDGVPSMIRKKAGVATKFREKDRL